MLIFNKLTGVFVRRRHSFSTEVLLVLWFLLYLIVNLPTSDTLFTPAFRIEHDPYSSNFPAETISGAPQTPQQLLQSLSQATTQAVLARAQRAANPNRGVGNSSAPAPVSVPVFVPAPVLAPAVAYNSDSEDDNMAGMTGYDVTIQVGLQGK